MKLDSKLARAQRNFYRFFSLTANPRSKRMRRAIKWTRVCDRLMVRPRGPLFFLARMGKTPH